MAYPAGVVTRPVTFGPAFELEDGDVAGMQVTFKATRPGVLWLATGQPAVSTQIVKNADDGVEQTVYLPVTDQTGWGDGDGNVIVPGDDGHVFLYIVTVIFTQNGRTIPGAQPRSKVVPIPAGDLSPLDLDKLIPLTTPGGTTVSVPDIWSSQIAEAQAAAVASAAASDEAVAAVAGKQDVASLSGDLATKLGTPADSFTVAVAAKIATRAVVKEQVGRNILDFDVVPGNLESQTTKIKAALDAHPGEPFWFPPVGSFRSDQKLSVTQSNPIIMDATLKAGAAMDTLIDWDNGASNANGYAQDCFLTGQGVLDASLNATKALQVGSVVRFSLGDGLTIKDPINRGIVLKAAGAEVVARDIRMHNSGTTNVADNIAVEVLMSDCQFSDIIARDFTVGLWNRGGANVYSRVHPWLGSATQLAARFADSVAFKFSNTCTLLSPYADTYRYGYQGDGTNLGVQVVNPRFFINSSNLSGALASANAGAVYDLGTSGHRVEVVGGQYTGHPSSPTPFTKGITRRFFSRGGQNLSDISAFGNFSWGIRLGGNSFTPTLEGSTGTGGNVYTAQEGYVEIREGINGAGFVIYSFRVECTVGSGTTGNLRIGNLPYPTGATGIRPGQGRINYVTGAVDATGLITSANTPVGPPWNANAQQAVLQKSAAGASSEVAAPASGTVVKFWGEVAVPYTHSTS